MKRIVNYVFTILAFIGLVADAYAQRLDSVDLQIKVVKDGKFNGAAYTLNMNDLKDVPVTNLSNLLTGMVPGFFSYQTSGGLVNEGASYWLRGIRTYAEGVLVLVDGQERNFGVLTPQEVESITVLKDATATVLYGTRAANGVILVNTKRGKPGKTRLTYTAQMINQEPLGLMKPVDAASYAYHFNQALRNDGANETGMFTDNQLSMYSDPNANREQYPNIDWLGKYFKNSSWVTRHNVNISGGNKNAQYFVNGGYIKQDGMFNLDEINDISKNNQASRYNLRSNLDINATVTTKLNLEIYGWKDQQFHPGGNSYGVYEQLITTPANAFPEYYLDNGTYLDPDGNRIISENGKLPAGNGLKTNPWSTLNRNGHTITNSTYGSFRAKLAQQLEFITSGLQATATFSMDGYTTAVTARNKSYSFYQFNNALQNNILIKTGNDGQMGNSISDRNGYARNSLNLMLSYDKVFDDTHEVGARVFYDQFENNNQVSIPDRFQTIGSWVNYNFADRYQVDFTSTYHGVYKLAPENRFGFFPAVSAGWIVSNEQFLKDTKNIISHLKLRASYGKVGNHRGVAEFRYMSRMNAISSVYNFGNAYNAANGFILDIIANPSLTWEESLQFNVGIDLKLFENRFNMTFDYFNDQRKNIYMSDQTVSRFFGLQADIEANIGEMTAKGWETGFSWNDKIGSLGYRLGGTYSYSTNEVLKTGEPAQPYNWMATEGTSRGLQKGYLAMGLFQSYEEIAAAPLQNFSAVHPGDIRYKDINQDGIIDIHDRVPIGYGTVPNKFYSFFAGINYKGLGLSAMLQGASEVSRNISSRVAFPFLSNGTIYEHQLDYWTPDNRDASLPRVSRNWSNVNNSQASSFWLRDGSYLRLKTVDLSYDFPKNLFGKSFIDNLRVFVNGYNLYVWKKDNGPLDPEDNSASDSMPITRNVSAGLSIRF